jgi:hypothetical protein
VVRRDSHTAPLASHFNKQVVRVRAADLSVRVTLTKNCCRIDRKQLFTPRKVKGRQVISDENGSRSPVLYVRDNFSLTQMLHWIGRRSTQSPPDSINLL